MCNNPLAVRAEPPPCFMSSKNFTAGERAMDYYQGVVYDYLQEFDGAMFIKADCPIQLGRGKTAPKGTFWYCDAVAVNLRDKKVYLCEVSYAKSLFALAKRLGEWSKEWTKLRAAIVRDFSIPDSWQVQPWVFVPAELEKTLEKRLAALPTASSSAGAAAMPTPKVTSLESVAPWKYRHFSSLGNETKGEV